MSRILPDEEMPVIEEGPYKGFHAEICLNPLGVTGRMNPAVLFELETNFIAMFVRENFKHNSLEQNKKDLLEFLDMVSKTKEQVEFTKKFFKEADKDELEYFFQELIENGIPVTQGPFFDNIDIFDLQKMYNFYEKKLGLKPFKFKDIKNRMCMGEIYILRLKHQPDNKSSARSTAFNDLKDLPAKDKEYKEFKTVLSKTPIKLGEMEVANLMLSCNPEAVKELLNTYATNPVDGEILERNLLTKNPFNTNFELSGTKSKTSEILDEFLYCLGIQLED